MLCACRSRFVRANKVISYPCWRRSDLSPGWFVGAIFAYSSWIATGSNSRRRPSSRRGYLPVSGSGLPFASLPHSLRGRGSKDVSPKLTCCSHLKLLITSNESALIKRHLMNHREFPNQAPLEQFFDRHSSRPIESPVSTWRRVLSRPPCPTGKTPATISAWIRPLAGSLSKP